MGNVSLHCGQKKDMGPVFLGVQNGVVLMDGDSCFIFLRFDT